MLKLALGYRVLILLLLTSFHKVLLLLVQQVLQVVCDGDLERYRLLEIVYLSLLVLDDLVLLVEFTLKLRFQFSELLRLLLQRQLELRRLETLRAQLLISFIFRGLELRILLQLLCVLCIQLRNFS